MAFLRALIQGFRGGSNFLAPPDQIPDGAVRLLQNSRLTRTVGVIASRAGMLVMTPVVIAADVVRALWTLFPVGTTSVRYAHVGSTLYRTDWRWQNATAIATDVGARAMSAVNMVDGEGGLWAYFTNGGGITPSKDNGTTTSRWGIAAPAAAPSASALATDLTTVIHAFDSAAGWTSAGLTAGPTAETTIKQEGTGSITITIAANTLGSLAQGVTVNLDTLTGGNADVKDDDYIEFFVRADRPDRVNYVQLDFDLDTGTVANAFKDNTYSINLPGLTWLNQGRDQWTKIAVAKSAFTRSGTNTALTWANVLCFRVSVMTTSGGACQLYLDALRLRGGFDLKGMVRYTICYRNLVTGCRGNPPIDNDDEVIYTTALEVDRRRVTLTLSNVIPGGADHPGDTQIDRILVYRSIDEGEAVRIATLSDLTATTYTDSRLVQDTLLAETLETDNNLAPNGAVVFGPGALNRLFMIVGRNKLRFSKAWESDENRVENWPTNFQANIGDGSEEAFTGLVSDSTAFVWSNQRTYTIQGYGEDTFLPLPVPNSRGVVGRFAVTEGDGRLFFVSQDGVYEQVGQQQRRLTDAIAPFFAGVAVMGHPGWDPTPSGMTIVRLTWHADVFAPFLLMLYAAGEDTGQANRELYIGRQPATGEYRDISFDSRGGGLTLRSIHRDPEENILYGGSQVGHVYHLEKAGVETDDTHPIPWRMVTRSEHFGAPHQGKYVAQAFVEMHTHGQNVTASALYEQQTILEAFPAPVRTTTPTTTVALATLPSEVFRHDMALEFSALSSLGIELSRYGWGYEPQPELITVWDSGQYEFGMQTIVQGVWYTILSVADILVQVILDVQGVTAYHIPHTAGRRQAGRFFCAAGSKGRLLRVTLSSAEPFRMYALRVRSKPYGADQDYQELPFLQEEG